MQNFIRWVLILSIMILLADRLFVEMIKLIWRHYGRSWPLWWGFYGNSKSEQTRRLGSVKGPVVYTSKRKPAPVSHPRKPALLTCPFWLLSFKCWHSEGTWTELCGFGTLLCSPRKWVQWERKTVHPELGLQRAGMWGCWAPFTCCNTLTQWMGTARFHRSNCLPRTCQRGFRHQDQMLQLPQARWALF